MSAGGSQLGAQRSLWCGGDNGHWGRGGGMLAGMVLKTMPKEVSAG